MADTTLDRITLLHGKLSDLKAVWWPFVALKPGSADTPISFRRTVAMTPCFAAWFLVIWLAKAALFGSSPFPAATEIAVQFAYFLGFFLIWFNAVTAPLWNRRIRITRAPGK